MARGEKLLRSGNFESEKIDPEEKSTKIEIFGGLCDLSVVRVERTAWEKSGNREF